MLSVFSANSLDNMKIGEILQNYGLNEKQVSIYLACLELGSASVQKIAQKANLARSTVYEVLDILKQKGFVSTFMKKKVRYYSAEEPGQVIRLAQQKVDSLKNVLPQLEAMVGYSRKRPTVRFYQGKEQMKVILEEVLDEADIILSFGSAEDLFRELGDYFYEFVKRRIKKKIPVRVVLRDSKKARERKELGPKELRTVKIVLPTQKFQGQTILWKDKIAMFSFTNDFVAIVIESRELSDMQKAMFEYLWEQVD